MTTPDPAEGPGKDEVLIYVRQPEAAAEMPEAAAETRDAFEPQFGLPGKRVLQKVEITDEELERLRKQVKRIASKLEASADAGEDERFAVDSVTLHVGVTASGNFVWASAGVEVAVDVTWRRRTAT
jgi:hypothetical protein